MATRENQGLQAAIIILVILSLGFGVGLLLVNNARKTQLARAVAAEAASTTARKGEAEAQAVATALKEITGFDDAQPIDAVRESFEADMAKWGQNIPAESRQYRTVLGNIYEENRKLVLNAATATEEVKTLKDRLLAVEAQKEEQVKQFQTQMEEVRADAAGEHQKFEEDYARINTEKDAIQKQMDELRAEHDDAMAKLDAEAAQFKNQIAKLETSIDRLRLGVPNPDQFAQPADGRITGVNQRYETVYIDLGSADGLRPQVTFAVAEAGLEDAAAAEQKGSIEVTKILGPHLAEAKITKFEDVKPLMRGDRVFSQVWDRGRQVGIGIAGFVDIDGDNVSDLERLKSIIAAGGGSVDASPDEAGLKSGNLNVSTRYLVLGELPQDNKLSGELRTSWNELSAEADDLGVETIALDEFLSLMGWQRQSRTVSMGPNARPEDFPAQPVGQELPRRPGEASGVFKKRLPQRTY